jgi:hypothetical protein
LGEQAGKEQEAGVRTWRRLSLPQYHLPQGVTGLQLAGKVTPARLVSFKLATPLKRAVVTFYVKSLRVKSGFKMLTI